MKDSNKLIIILIILVVVLMIIMTLRILLPVASVSDKQTDEILNTAQNAKKQVDEEITLGDYVSKNKLAEEKEKISLSVMQLTNKNEFDSITEEDLSTELQNKEINANVTEIFDDGEKLFEVQSKDSNNLYRVNSKGIVTLIQE